MAEPAQDVDVPVDEEMKNAIEEPKEDEVDPAAPATEAKMPTRKDTSLKEFLAKMDDYAPIVCLQIFPTFLSHDEWKSRHLADLGRIDPRCRDEPLPDPRGPPPTPANRHPPRSPARACNAEIHRRHCRRRLPIQQDSLLQLSLQQPDG